MIRQIICICKIHHLIKLMIYLITKMKERNILQHQTPRDSSKRKTTKFYPRNLRFFIYQHLQLLAIVLEYLIEVQHSLLALFCRILELFPVMILQMLYTETKLDELYKGKDFLSIRIQKRSK